MKSRLSLGLRFGSTSTPSLALIRRLDARAPMKVTHCRRAVRRAASTTTRSFAYAVFLPKTSFEYVSAIISHAVLRRRRLGRRRYRAPLTDTTKPPLIYIARADKIVSVPLADSPSITYPIPTWKANKALVTLGLRVPMEAMIT
ncbi:hypothetical protein EVAR_40716_1 [Eumeta japonica]|uniref:Uncharacterized protein n=1 Tax=Eumeta variegata TaxID=151549 RepID=A0A4C1X8F9_EUMVA|nr:hypothetical protein EVAR_40716_1 [Eumeta japonica]